MIPDTTRHTDSSRQPRYSVIIPAYNEESCLPTTLRDLRKAMASVGIPGEVIVVDNNSTDRTADVARAFGARVVREDRNQISRARNAGARAAAGDFLFFLDADSSVSRRLLRTSLRRLLIDGWHGGSAVVRFHPRPPRIIRVLEWSWNLFSRLTGMGSGCFLFCRREVFGAVGGFSTRLYIGEDTAFCLAARLRGHSVRIITRAPIVTSSRKFTWFSIGRLITIALKFAAFPFAVFSRDLCALWYERPAVSSLPERTVR